MKCPGQDMQYWKDDAIFDAECPECGATVEFYKDDTTRKCHSCEHRFVNPQMDFGCASYCQYAEQCLGTLPEDFLGSREDLLKDKVAVEVKRFYHTDFSSIKKATNVARFVESIGKSEGGNLGVLLCAAYLHGLEQGQTTEILSKAGAASPLIESIHSLLATTADVSAEDELGRKILLDALLLFGSQESLKNSSGDPEDVKEQATRQLHFDSAKTLLEEIIL